MATIRRNLKFRGISLTTQDTGLEPAFSFVRVSARTPAGAGPKTLKHSSCSPSSLGMDGWEDSTLLT